MIEDNQKLGLYEVYGEKKEDIIENNSQNIEEAVIQSDLVIGAVLVPGAKAPKLVTRDMIASLANEDAGARFVAGKVNAIFGREAVSISPPPPSAA